MPELPDITLYLDALHSRVVGHPLERIVLKNPFLLRSVEPPLQAFEGRKVLHLRRLGKRIAFGFEGDLWLKNAANANRCAKLLGQRLARIPGARVVRPVEVNAVFVELTPAQHASLAAAGFAYYSFIGQAARFVCSWATTDADIDALLAALAS